MTRRRRRIFGKEGSGPPTFTTLDPSNTGSGILLSNGNLTATSTGASGFFSSRSIASHSSGKYYCEFEVTNNAGNGVATSIGIMNAAGNPSGLIGFDGNNSIAYFGSGGAFINSSSVSGTPQGFNPPTDIASMAVDLTAQLIWVQVNGTNWNGSGIANPALGLGGISIAVISDAYFAAVGIEALSTPQLIANFGLTPYEYPPPSDFGNW